MVHELLPYSLEERIEKALETARANTREASTDRLFATYDRIYEDFQLRKELFTDIEKAKEFDFVKELLSVANAGSNEIEDGIS